MQDTNSSLAIFILIVGVIASAIAGYFVWKNVDYFISRKDRYINSPFDLLKKKIGITATAVGAVIFIAFVISNSLMKKEKDKNKNTAPNYRSK